MKILIIQITRFGDILTTLPIISALRRDNLEGELHFLVRKRFAFAAEACKSIDHLWKLDSKEIIEPLFESKISESLNTLTKLVRELRSQRFDRIINLSFSPSSSFISHLISDGKTPVLGYTRPLISF